MRTVFKKRLTVGGQSLQPIEDQAFVLRIDTSISHPDFPTTTEMAIPINGSGYNCEIDWGDGTVEALTDIDVETVNNEFSGFLHNYESAGIYRIQITGTFPQIKFLDHKSGDVDKIAEMRRWARKVIELEQWGTIVWNDMEEAFNGCINMRGTYTDNPDTANVISMELMFGGCYVFNSPLDIDGSSVTTTARMFASCYLLNKPISISNTTNLTNMHSMFGQCRSFNSSITIDTTNVTNMSTVFALCASYNQPVTFLTTTNVTNFGSMFRYCINFNQPVTSIDTSSAINVHGMFSNCVNFNQPVNHFDLTNVTSKWGTTRMFHLCKQFNQPVGNLGPANIKRMSEMFRSCWNFDGTGIELFDLSGLTDKHGMDLFALGCDFPCAQYDDILNAFDNDKSTKSYRTDLVPHFGVSQYNTDPGEGQDARNSLEFYGWTLYDGGECGSTPPVNTEVHTPWTFRDEGYFLFTNTNVQDSALHDRSQRDWYTDPNLGPDMSGNGSGQYYGSPWSFGTDDGFSGIRLDVEDDNTCHPNAPDYATGDTMPTSGDFAPPREHHGVFNDNEPHTGTDTGPPQVAEAYVIIQSTAHQRLRFLINGLGERADPADGNAWDDTDVYEEMRIFVELVSDPDNPPAMGGREANAGETWVSWNRAPGGAGSGGSCVDGVDQVVTFADFPDDHETDDTRVNDIELLNGPYYRIRVHFSTRDAWYHVAAFYELLLEFGPI